MSMSMKCPRCPSAMKDVRGVAVCGACGGAFVACAAVDTVRRAFDEHAQSMAALAAERAARPIVSADGKARLACPSCAREMSRFLVGPLEVDTCLEHGSWYDRGELVAVRDALLAGAPTAEIANSSAVAPAQAPLELARAPQRPRPSTPMLGGAIDEGANAAIQRLIKHEHEEMRRARARRRAHGLHHGHSHSSLELVEDILDILDILDIFD